MKILIKTLIPTLLLLTASCEFMMQRDNANDPGSDNYTPPVAVAEFTASVTEGNVRLAVNFTDKSSGDIAAWEWDFNNDGITDSTEQNPAWIYDLAGTYSVKLKVREKRGLVSDELVKPGYIYVTVGYPEMNIIKNDFNGAISVAAADVDNDGDRDIIGASYWEGEIIWFENEGASLIEHKITENTFCFWSVIPADIDGDGDIDFISAGPYSYSMGIYWWENLKGENEDWKDVWPNHAVDPSFAGAHHIRAEDMDNDGDIDIVGAAYEDAYGSGANSEISWWENEDINEGTGDGNASSWEKHKLTTDNTGEDFKGIANISVTDPDVDGDRDIAYTERATEKTSILENKKGDIEPWEDNFTEHTIDAGFSEAEGIFSADVDGDGDSDIIGVSHGTWNAGLGIYENSIICWWENDNNGSIPAGMDAISWEKHIVYEDFDGGRAVIAEDIDGDGDTDIIAASSNSDTVIWCENKNNHGTGWTGHVINMHFHSAYSLDTADIDNDGDMDILCASMGNWSSANNYYYISQIAWWEIIY